MHFLLAAQARVSEPQLGSAAEAGACARTAAASTAVHRTRAENRHSMGCTEHVTGRRQDMFQWVLAIVAASV